MRDQIKNFFKEGHVHVKKKLKENVHCAKKKLDELNSKVMTFEALPEWFINLKN